MYFLSHLLSPMKLLRKRSFGIMYFFHPRCIPRQSSLHTPSALIIIIIVIIIIIIVIVIINNIISSIIFIIITIIITIIIIIIIIIEGVSAP